MQAFSIVDMVNRVKTGWDFALFMRLSDQTYPALIDLSKEMRKLNIPLYTYVLVGTPRNTEILKQIGWEPTTTINNVVNYVEKLNGIVDGVIATCAGDYQGDLEVLKALNNKFRKR